MICQWKATLQKKLKQTFGAKKGAKLFDKYQDSFSTSYYEECTPEVALSDIQHVEELSRDHPLKLIFYTTDNSLHLRLFQFTTSVPLSEVLPIFENMDLQTYYEHPYEIKLSEHSFWVNDFTVIYTKAEAVEIEKVTELFQNAFINIRFGLSENDGFNKLVLGAQLSWREITILRTYAKYLSQIGFSFSQMYIAETLANHAAIARALIDLFFIKFDPARTSQKMLEEKEKEILQQLKEVVSLDEDKIIQRLLELIKATLRTNYFQKDGIGHTKEYLAIKLSSRDIPELPSPKPLYEIFVYSPRFEGIHLRSSKVARGGIRWSDRREDFRTEILDLMKAQIVKNAIIVPSGAKGGFILKRLRTQARYDIKQEVIYCYESFIRGLLDLTDNLKNTEIIKPSQVVCYDGDDPYLVVAADKGTATFSDRANSISKEYGFWLGDAFASGGSTGYDHKKIGITSRGAWESLKRHLLELDININESDITVVGIGDMSGDVFGNGMIYTAHIKLIGAFDYRHIFLDPNPNPDITYQERVRLFNLPTSSWEDFNPDLISKGGGVYKRSSKSISLSPEVKKVLDINADSMTPNDLICALLKAPVDLLWNGGIGTYVKASIESNADAGDKANELCRVNGNELRCRVVCEGGNLGFTQLGRVEYALRGGLINTDFIDNSGGVDCSNHEVNIKILLNQEVQKNNIDENERNKMLVDMTSEVVRLVLTDNYDEALAMSLASFHSSQLITTHINYIKELEAAGILNRVVEFIPDDKALLQRKTSGIGLTRPELAVLLAYTKIYIKNEILKSEIKPNRYLNQFLYMAFPVSLQRTYRKELLKHSLHREILATQLSNLIANKAGIVFIYNLQNETGATVFNCLCAYIVSSQIFETFELWQLIEALDNRIPIHLQYELFDHIHDLIYQATRWFLRHKKLTSHNMEETIHHFAKSVKALEKVIPQLMNTFTQNYFESLSIEFSKVGISVDLARRIVATRYMYNSLNIVEIATKHHFDLIKCTQLYFAVGDKFKFPWFRDYIAEDTREGYWENLARLTLHDELDILQSRITSAILKNQPKLVDTNEIIQEWVAQNQRTMQRWGKIVEMLRGSITIDYTMFFVALRELFNLIGS
jgi:glutamate dehydrogenase